MNTTLSTATTSLDTAGVDIDRTDTPEPRRRSRWARRGLAATAAIAVLAAGGVAAAAVPSFDDVPENHPFFDEIEWMADTGITTGYDDGGFHPNDPVTRQAMAAFMQRLYNLQDTTYAIGDGTARTTESSTWQQIGLLSREVVVPEGTRGWVHADLSGESSCYDGTGYCRVRIMYEAVDNGEDWEMWPMTGSEFGFDSSDGQTEGSSSWEAHAISRSTISSLLPGTYRVWAEYSVTSNGTTFRLDDTNLRVDVDLQAADL